jgi:4-hydroxy-tetrahydrodipicolinate synthase
MLLPVFQTPFHDDEAIDYDTLAGELDWLLEQGADGVVMAMVSETLRLASDERDGLCEFVCQSMQGRATTVISVGAESGKVAERHAQHAEQCGATMLMAIPPIAVALDEVEIANYYRRIASAVTIPLIVQDASGYVGRPMSIELQVRLMDEFGPERVMFKPEAPPLAERLAELRAVSQRKALCFEGSGGVALMETFPHGLAGTKRIHIPLAKLIGLQTTLDSYLAVEKHLLVRQGVFTNTVVRGPVGYRLTDEVRAQADRWFDELIATVS